MTPSQAVEAAPAPPWYATPLIGWLLTEAWDITDGPTLDETLANLREAIELHLEDEDPAEFGLVPNPGLQITFQTELASAQT